ncbi:MAG: glycoside hydrolase family 127 protein, partial [Verrucomicrobiota bacterium]|nr:glycoside hydrolase family 127 protein [Verrucomicrobiota bacterium]
AAVAYARATGKTKLLEVAEKSAQHVNRAFFVGDPDYNDGNPVNQAPGHQEIELGLTKLYLYTGNRLYLDMAKRFLDIRGITFIPDGSGVSSPTYAQQHKPVAEQTEAVGHAVRAAYQYAAMAEVDGLLGTTDYTGALNAIWHDIVDTKMHITGGLGAVHGIEGFGPSFVLPNKDTYLETCAAVGNVLFNMRMFLKYGDARYVDVAEVALLNNCLSGIGLDGTSFFYPNPLEADAGHQLRSGWFGTACCPSNLSRLIPQVSGYMYAATGSDLFCALYGSNESELALERGRVSIRQTTEYPFDGRIELELKPDQEMPFRLHVRIPTWRGARLVPGELYAYNEPSEPGRISVNGEEITPVMQKGFAVLERTWKAGDRVVLELPMPVKASLCDARVEANRGRVAFSRGPLVLCAEGADNGEPVQRFQVDPSAAAAGAKQDWFESGGLTGIPRVTLTAFEQVEGGLQPARLVMIPYYAWSNRDQGSMLTWIPVIDQAGQEQVASTSEPRD